MIDCVDGKIKFLGASAVRKKWLWAPNLWLPICECRDGQNYQRNDLVHVLSLTRPNIFNIIRYLPNKLFSWLAHDFAKRLERLDFRPEKCHNSRNILKLFHYIFTILLLLFRILDQARRFLAPLLLAGQFLRVYRENRWDDYWGVWAIRDSVNVLF